MSALASASRHGTGEDPEQTVVPEEYEGPAAPDEGPRDRISPLLILGVAVFAIVEALRLGVGDFSRPGPGLWPLLVAGTAAALTPVIFVVGQRFSVPERSGLLRVVVILAALWLFVVAYPWMGFVGAGALMVFLVTRVAAREGWVASLLLSALAPAAAYVLFGTLLGVNLRLF
ncbi:tripartite tricarboxylate transporter TctB family protein [Kocuria sp. M1R5S2]|uniref:tripartite tricarboxylate transporter TctB family protein n=1 Tax=Kocuria rhizosphaerae TaxID=3376285 RepID=UPI0037A04EAF